MYTQADTRTMPLGPQVSPRRRDQVRKAKAEPTLQQKVLQGKQDAKIARAKALTRQGALLRKHRASMTQTSSSCACMQFFSKTGAIWYIIDDVRLPGLIMATTDKNDKLVKHFITAKIRVSFPRDHHMNPNMFESASVLVWRKGSKAAKRIQCLCFNAERVESFLTERGVCVD